MHLGSDKSFFTNFNQKQTSGSTSVLGFSLYNSLLNFFLQKMPEQVMVSQDFNYKGQKGIALSPWLSSAADKSVVMCGHSESLDHLKVLWRCLDLTNA